METLTRITPDEYDLDTYFIYDYFASNLFEII